MTLLTPLAIEAPAWQRVDGGFAGHGARTAALYDVFGERFSASFPAGSGRNRAAARSAAENRVRHGFRFGAATGARAGEQIVSDTIFRTERSAEGSRRGGNGV